MRKSRELARIQFHKQMAKEKAIGIDPQFSHFKPGVDRVEASKQWNKKSKRYDELN